MKKINTSEANAIVGGTKRTCTISHEAVGDACFKVTTCVNKHGKVKSRSSVAADLDLCGISVPG